MMGAKTCLVLAAFGLCSTAQAHSEQAAKTYTARDAGLGAGLRSNIGVVIGTLYHPCPKTEIVKPAVERFEALRDGQASYARQIDFAIARADYDHQMSLVDIHCPELSDEEQQQSDETTIAIADSSMDRIEIILANLAEEN